MIPLAGPKNIILLSGLRIFPTFTGGHIHSGGIARALARMGHSVRIYGLAGRSEDYRGGGKSLVVEIEPNLVEETNLGLGYGLPQTIARRLGLPRAWQYGLLNRGFLPTRLKQLLQEADIVIADLPFVPPVPGPWQSKPWFLISHNLEHRLLEQGTPREQRYASWMRALEERAPQRYHDIFACAEEDRDFYRQHDASGQKQLPIVRSGVDPFAYVMPAGTREATRAELGVAEDEHLVVFSGSAFGPNAEALKVLKNFADAEAGWLLERRIRLLILGAMEPAPYRRGALIATARVPVTTPYFLAADAGLNPVTTGSGANVKLFEYLATRLPVISTTFGVRGSAMQAERDYISYQPLNPKPAFETLVQARSRADWRSYAEAVWQRHKSDCDIRELVQQAVSVFPELQLP